VKPDDVNVVTHLERLAFTMPEAPAVHLPVGEDEYETFSYAFLNNAADSFAHQLSALGMGKGTLVAVMVPPGLDFFALTFALFKLAAVPVLIDPGMGVGNLGRCLNEAKPEAFVGILKAHTARRVLGWGRSSVRITANVGTWRWGCQASLWAKRDGARSPGPFRLADVKPGDAAAVLFTSGSTGVAKGACYTHGIFAAQVEMLKKTYGIQPGEVDLCTFPLFALFGPALGMQCVVPRMDPRHPARIDPDTTCDAITRFQVTNLFGSPAVLRRLAESPNLSPTPFATLKRVISAGAPADTRVLATLAPNLPPGTQIFTPYGATESLPVANVGSEEILRDTKSKTEQGAGVCIGRPVEGLRVHIVRITDEAIPVWSKEWEVPQGTVGELVIRGPVVTPQYHNRPQATAMAKIRDEHTGEVLHRMGDVGYLDDTGRLWFCGRKSHRVETPDRVYFTDMVEPVFNTVPGIKRTALVGVKKKGQTVPVVVYEVGDWRVFDAAALQAKALTLPQTTNLKHFLLYPKPFPMDVRHNSKIFREKIQAWAQTQTGERA
jgi:acyl-CoA synthetase (AMP-forming)/AMP-acid ligase II